MADVTSRMNRVGRLAAGLVFGILLHALLMAGSVGATPSMHSALSGGGAQHHHRLCGEHANRCFTVRNVTRPSVTQVLVVGPLIPPPGQIAAVPRAYPGSTPPHHPPDVLRALLQVYRM